jgi:hypothetical protein
LQISTPSSCAKIRWIQFHSSAPFLKISPSKLLHFFRFQFCNLHIYHAKASIFIDPFTSFTFSRCVICVLWVVVPNSGDNSVSQIPFGTLLLLTDGPYFIHLSLPMSRYRVSTNFPCFCDSPIFLFD